MSPFEYLKKIEENGYSCYIVGGYVRDKLLNIESYDVDIATSARPGTIAEIFDTSDEGDFGCIRICDDKLNIDITTYRKESGYENRHPNLVEFIDDIDEDLKRRDFTVNAICMNSRKEIYDPLNGCKDLEKGIVRVIGDFPSKFIEDPLRMLRALRLSIIYNFKIEEEAFNFILQHKDYIARLSYERKKSEIDKILTSGKGKEGIRTLDNLGILSALGIEMKLNYEEVDSLLSAWAQLDAPDYPFSKIEKRHLANIRAIVSDGKIDKKTIFLYGLEDNILAGQILKIDEELILKIYGEMPIRCEKDLNIGEEAINSILKIESGPSIKEVKKDLLSQVLSGNLPNSEKDLLDYINENWK